MAIWFQPFTLADLTATSRHSLDERLGIEWTGFGDDWIQATMPVDAGTRQPFGLLHGGASVALAESVGSIGANLCVDRAKWRCLGQSITANHVMSVRDGIVTGTGRPIHRGGRSQVWQIDVRDPAGALVSLVMLTIAVIRAA